MIIHDSFTQKQLITIKDIIENYYERPLQQLINNDDFLKNLKKQQKKNLIYHIIFKGKNFYNLVLEDITISYYLYNLYHNLYDIILNSINLKRIW